MLICTGITFVAVYRGTGTQLRHQIDQEIAATRASFTYAPLLRRTFAHQLAQVATRYVRAQPFSASSTLLFTGVPGVGTSTNNPEVFAHSSPDNGESAAVQAQENLLARQLVSVHDGYSTLRLPDVGDLRLLKHS